MASCARNAHVLAVKGILCLTVIKMNIRPHRRCVTGGTSGGKVPGEFPAMGILVTCNARRQGGEGKHLYPFSCDQLCSVTLHARHCFVATVQREPGGIVHGRGEYRGNKPVLVVTLAAVGDRRSAGELAGMRIGMTRGTSSEPFQHNRRHPRAGRRSVAGRTDERCMTSPQREACGRVVECLHRPFMPSVFRVT
jgi:hypothetical protein